MVFWVTLAAFEANAQSAAPKTTERLPRFEDYPVTEIFKGTPAAPKIVRLNERRYRTRIREGVSKGWGVFRDGKEQPGPNFAGHYIVVSWGCGSPCAMIAVVDAETGIVYDPPLCWGSCAQSFAIPLLELRVAEVDYRLNSRLMVMKASPEQSNRLHAPCFAYYFLRQENGWTLLRRMWLRDSFKYEDGRLD